MGEFKQNRNHGFSLYFTEDEKQWLRVLAEKDRISMAEEVRRLIMDEKDRVVKEMNKKYRKKKDDKMTLL